MATTQADGDRVNAKLTEFSTPDDREPPVFGDDMGTDAFRDACEAYAEWAVNHYDVFDPVDLSDVTIEVSTKLKRAAGKAGAKNKMLGDITGMYMRFAFGAYEKWGWSEEIRETIRHELVHLAQYEERGEGGHGFDFELKADKADCPKHCKQFTDYKYHIFCSGCGDMIDGRHKKSKLVKQPESYRSKCCSEPLESRRA
jgi:hypothetical protein